ncbi:MAG: hypothetical protein ACK5M8_13335 [Shewanella algae]
MFLREQTKSVSAFPANPIRARILAREIERFIIDVCPPPAGKSCRLQHVTRWVELNEDPSSYKGGNADEIPSLRRPFSRWLNGTALPSSATRIRLDELFKAKLATKWCGRGIDGPEQALLVAMDLISRNGVPNNQGALFEADALLSVVNTTVCELIPRIPNLERPKFTSYHGGKALTSSVNRKSSRYAVSSKKRPVAYPLITERINPYDSVSPLCAALMYLVKPNNQTHLPDGLAQALLLDVISGVIAAYIVMLHRNPSEFQTGGLVVDLYRMVYRIFLYGEAKVSNKGAELVSEVFYNSFQEFPDESDEMIITYDKLIKLFRCFIDKSGLSSTEFMALVEPVNPDCDTGVLKWWNGRLA